MAAEASYARMRAGKAHGIGLRDGELVATGWRARLATVAASVAGRLAATVAMAALFPAAIFMGFTYMPESGLPMVAAVAAFCAAATLGWFTLDALRQPVRALEAHLAAIAAGEFGRAIETPPTPEFWRLTSLLRATRARFAYAMQERQELDRRAQEERATTQRLMSGEVERSIGGIVNALASAATALQSSTDSLAGIAHNTAEQATAAATGAAHANANMQTVAASVEEMANSVAEISRQVAEAAGIARRAAEEARATDTTVRSLADGAQRIGDVVRLIGDIAG